MLRFAAANGLNVNVQHPNRMLMDVSGPVSHIENAFQIKMRLSKHPTENRNFFAPDVEPSVPNGVPVLDISGLSNYKLPHPNDNTKLEAPQPKCQRSSAPGRRKLHWQRFQRGLCSGRPLTGPGQRWD